MVPRISKTMPFSRKSIGKSCVKKSINPTLNHTSYVHCPVPMPLFNAIVQASDRDTSNFDEEFTNEAPLDSVVGDSHLSETIQQKFHGFTYNPDAYMGQAAKKD